ncbi:UEV domain-containing protein [Multifurca ochricompacta]|uniref:UEV domain-containing protein n=1 Tax=Multifurca ochricompacta TaxID=376703 RepID=A0AAD4MAB6_9AGAM|nr:UEV domain-containing protein [Multifurca ochricompacta]
MSSSASESLTLTQKWLQQNITTYNDRNRVFSDVDSTLSLYTTLRPKTDVYTYDDGRTQLLLCVHGLLPITYRQASYHIPIALWLTRQYPREPPLAFVVPTSDMLVRPSKSIDVSGLCRIEYILNWEKKYEGCDLQSLIQAMQHYFSSEPPVYSKLKQQSGPSGSRPSQPQEQQDEPSRPPPLVPRPPIHSSPPIASPSASSSPSRPTIPPKPPSTIAPTIPQTFPPSVQGPHSDNHSPIHPQYHNNTLNPNLPRKPPLPPPLFSSPSQPLHSPAPTHTHNKATSIGTPFQLQQTPSGWHTAPSVQPSETVPSSSRWTLPPSQSHSPTTVVAYLPSIVTGPDPIPPPPPLPAYEHPPVPPNLLLQQSTSTPAPPHLNLLDEDNTTAGNPRNPPILVAPPRPPNPELLQLHARVHDKLRTELISVSQAMTLDGERLRAQQADLLTGDPAIRDEMARLEAVRDVCRSVATRLREVVQTAERGVAELKRKGDPPVDELVCSTSIVHNQLIDLVAEDNAIEDTIYHLHRALNAGRIDLDRFLRTTRVLAEEQFMKRALIERIQASLPMGASVDPGWA